MTGASGDRRTEAETRHSWWPGWIWIVPVAVLLVVGWLIVRAIATGGENITIAFSDVHGLDPHNAKIMYRGMKVGTVSGISLGKKGDTVEVKANIADSAAPFLRAGTLFWLRGATPSLSDLSSLGSLLSGPTLVMQPGPGKKTTQFTGLAYKPPVPGAYGVSQFYIISFKGAVGGLKRGDAVKLRGFTVGTVRTVGLRYNPGTGQIATPATVALYPADFHVEGQAANDQRAALRGAIATLVQKGLRARLSRDPPLIGGYGVTLDMIPGAPTASLAVVDGLSEIPVAPGGGLSSIVDRLNKVPIDQIAQNVLDITKHVDTVVASPKLKDSIVQLDAALRQIHQTVHNAGPQITQLVKTLRHTAGQLDAAAQATRKVLSGTQGQNGLPETMQEIADAARSVRALANYLDSHPEALIQGRSGD